MRREDAHDAQKDLFKAGHPTRLVPHQYVPTEKRYEYFLEDCTYAECRLDMLHQQHELLKNAHDRLKVAFGLDKKPKLSVIQGGKQ